MALIKSWSLRDTLTFISLGLGIVLFMMVLKIIKNQQLILQITAFQGHKIVELEGRIPK